MVFSALSQETTIKKMTMPGWHTVLVIQIKTLLQKNKNGAFMNSDIEGLISVIIPTYNAADYLEETLQSVLTQSYKLIEVIVVDDGSTDNTEALITKYNDPRLHYIKQANSGGPAHPRNVGVAASNGEYIAIFDSDDLMMPNKLASQINAFKAVPDAAFCCTNFAKIDDKGNITTPDFWLTNHNFQHLDKSKRDAFGNFYYTPNELTDNLFIHNFIATSSMLIRKDVFETLGGFDETLANADDYDMWLRISPLYSGILIPQVLHQYRLRDGNITSRGIHKLVDGRVAVLKRHINKTSNKHITRHVKRTITRYQLAAGYHYFQHKDLKRAKQYYIQSLYILPTFTALKYIFSCIMGKHFIKTMRYLKHCI